MKEGITTTRIRREIIQKEMIRKKRISMMENNENQRTHMKEEVGHEIILKKKKETRTEDT